MKRNTSYKRIFSIVIAALLFYVTISNYSSAAAIQKATVSADNVSIRSGAGTNYKKLGTYKKGTIVSVYNKTATGWSEIRYKGKKAFLSTKYLSFQNAAGIKITQHYYKNIKNIKYPQLSGLKNKTVEKKINLALQNTAKTAYVNYLSILKDEKEIQGDPICKEMSFACDYDYQSSYNVKFNDGKSLSILFNEYMYTGGAHGLGNVKSLNFNLKTGSRVFISQLLNTSSKLNKVKHYAYQAVKNNENFFVDKLSDIPLNKDSQFYFTNGGMYLVFQEYEVAAYAYGNPVIKIPSSIYK